MGRNSYVANTGLAGQWQGDTLAYNGIIHNRLQSTGPDGETIPVGPNMRLDDLADGQGFTALVSESLYATPWHRVGFLNATNLASESRDSPIKFPATSQFTQGFCWRLDVDDKQTVINVANSTDKMTPQNAKKLSIPSSGHTEGCYVGFADGAARFVTDSIDAKVYRSILIPNDSQSSSPTPKFKLTDELSR